MIEANKTSKNWLPRQRPLRDRNIDNRPFIGSHSSTNSANLVKIGPVDVEIVSLTEIGKNKYETRAEWSGVRPSVGLSHRSTTATAAAGLLLSASVCSRYRSTAAGAVVQAPETNAGRIPTEEASTQTCFKITILLSAVASNLLLSNLFLNIRKLHKYVN